MIIFLTDVFFFFQLKKSISVSLCWEICAFPTNSQVFKVCPKKNPPQMDRKKGKNMYLGKLHTSSLRDKIQDVGQDSLLNCLTKHRPIAMTSLLKIYVLKSLKLFHNVCTILFLVCLQDHKSWHPSPILPRRGGHHSWLIFTWRLPIRGKHTMLLYLQLLFVVILRHGIFQKVYTGEVYKKTILLKSA